MTFEPPRHALGLAASTVSGAPGAGALRGRATPVTINASADPAISGEARDGNFAAALEQAGALMLLIFVWVGLHALKWAGKPL